MQGSRLGQGGRDSELPCMPHVRLRLSADPGQSANPTIHTWAYLLYHHPSCKHAVMKFDCAGCTPTLRYLRLCRVWMARRYPSIDAQLHLDPDLLSGGRRR
jgi:hypothetical protein